MVLRRARRRDLRGALDHVLGTVPPLVLAGALVISGCGSGQSSPSAAGGGSTGPAAASRTSTGADSSAVASAASVPSGDWTRFDYDAARSGVGPADTGITAANASALTPRTVHITGVADSSAVELHAVRVRGRRRDVAVITTTYGRTLAIDPGTGRKLWQFVPRDIGAYQGSAQVTTASPVLDPNRRFVYAATPDGLIRKLSVVTGHEVRSGRWPARITGNPRREKIGGALNLSGRDVIAVTGGYYGDAPPYQGHVALIDRRSGRVAHIWNSLCSDRRRLINPTSSCPASDSAIWARAGVVVEPGSGRLLVATGNGPFNGSTNWGDSVLELSPNAGRLLQNWTPANQARLEATDADLGSTAPALLPSAGGPRLAVQGGKDGHLHLIDLRRLNGGARASSRLGGELQTLSSPSSGEVLTAPAVWSHGGRAYVFVANERSTVAYVLTAGSRPRLAEVWHQVSSGTSPAVAGGLLYVYDQFSGEINVRKPLSGTLVTRLPAGPGHWSSPIVVGGRVILPVGGSTSDSASNSTLFVFHLPGR